MLKASFCCFPGIGESAEARLWQAGVLTWAQALKWPRPLFSIRKWDDLRAGIGEASVAYEAGMLDYFLNRFRGVNKARILPDIREGIGYLDIETDGLGREARVTTIALRCDDGTNVFVRGVNLAAFLPAVSRCKLLVTYNGGAFDLPLLRKLFQIDLGMPHVDLMHVLRAIGCRGGLKAAEKTLGVPRRYSEGMDGREAIELWRSYETHGDQEVLKKLMLYNAEDALVLETLLAHAYNHAMSSYPGDWKRVVPAQSRDLMSELFFDN